MLEKILDNKNTFEGKVLNVFLAVVLVLSLSNLSAFAQDGTQGSSAQTAGTQQSDGTIADGASSTNEQAVQGVLQHGSDAVAGDASAEQASPIASSEVNEAVVTFETNHAYVSVKDQILYAKTLTTELHKELKFVASADTGYQVGEIKAKNSSNADVPVTTQDGISVIAADYVDSTLVISVSAVSVGAEAPSGNETKPITNNTLIGVDEPGVAVIHTVTFTAEGSETQTQKIVDGSTCIEPITPAIPSGKVSFLGWYQKLASGELSADRFDFATAITSDIELVAKFSDKWAVLFTDNDGKVITTQEVSNNGTATNIGPITPPVGQSFDAWYLNGSPYNFSTPVTSNITLTPHFVTSRYIYFVSMGSAVAPQLVNDGQLAVQPPNPTREGYTFQFWSTSEDGSTGAYDFSKPVTSDLVLYGIWKGKTVNYVVVYNFEKANIPGDAGVSPDNYLFSEQNTLSAVAGTTVSAADLYATGKLAPSSGTDLAKYGYFAFGDTSTISGNGSTVLNVYYKRIMYTVQFDLNSSGKWMTFNGTTYNNGSTKYSFPAKYEQDIDSLWVSSKNATFWTSGSQGFAGWTNSKFSGTLVSHRLTMTSDIVAAADSSNIITAKATWANVTTSQVNYWLEIADYNNIPAGAVQKANGKWYSSNNEYTQRITLSGTLGPKSIGGFDKNTSYNESGWKNVGGTWVYTYDFYYDRLTYTLSFNTMGGSAISAISNIRYESPMSSYRPADPIRPNYVFKGWYLDSDYKIPYDFSSAIMPGSNVQLYAKWESSQYSANFYTHKGDATPLLSQGIAEGTFVKDPGTYVVGHPYDGLGEFLGWYWYLPGTDRLVSYSWETPVSGNVNLYAQWKTNGFTVTYDKGVGQGTVPVDSNTYALGSLAPVQGAQLTVAGKTFVGWQVDGAGRTYYPGNTIKMNGNVKLVARYINPSLAVTLTFNANYGLIPATEKWTAEKNDWVTLPTSMFDRAGYKFTGWNTKADGSGTSYSASSALLMTASVTLYAQWEIDFSSLDAKGFKKKYDGVAQSVTVTGALSTDVVEYYVGGHKVNNSFTNVNDSSDVTVKVTRDGKIWEKTVNVSITPAPLLVTTPNANKVYDGSALTAQGTLTGLVAGESAAFSTTGTQTKVGSSSNTYSLNWNGSAKQSNYSITESLGVLSVTEFAGNVVVATTGGIFTYDGNLHAATVKVTGLPSGYVVDKASSSTAATDATSSPIPATADTLVIKNADGEDVTSKLRVSYVNDTLVINPAAVTLTSQSLTKAYDTNPLTNGNTALATESGWAAGEGATYTFSGSQTVPGSSANAFSYTLNSNTRAANYLITKTEGTLTVTKAPAADLGLTANPYSGVYDAASHHIAVSTLVTEGTTLFYSLDNQTWVAGNPGFTNVVSGAIVYVKAENSNYETAYASSTVTITPATVTIKADNSGKTYGTADPALTAKVVGLQGSDEFMGTYAVVRDPGETAGTYAINVNNAVFNNSNYLVKTEPGTFIITPAGGAALIVSDTTKTYDNTPLEPTGFLSIGLTEGDHVDNVVYRGSQTNAGRSEANIESFVIRNAQGDDVTGNYANIQIIPGTLTVTPAPVTITVRDAAKVEGNADPAFSGSVEGLIADGDLGAITYVRSGGHEAAGVYPDVLGASYTQNPNYVVTVRTATFTITAAPVTPVTPPTPTPLPTPDDPLAPILTPIVDALQGAVEAVIGDNGTPLAQNEQREAQIGDNETPLANNATCWVHWYMILGIIITALYTACVALRRGLFSHKLKRYEDDLIGGGDPTDGSPSPANDETVPLNGSSGNSSSATTTVRQGE